MIIVCKNCRASFIVPTSTFANGPRTVRCAVCKSVWKEIPAGRTQPPKKERSTQLPLPPSPSQITPGDLPVPPLPENEAPVTQTETVKQPFSFSFNPLLAAARHLLIFGFLGLFAVTLFSAAVFVAGHRIIIEHWPQMQAYYIQFGLAKDPLKDNLELKNITSERRYIDGAMQLIVSGEIDSHAKKTQVVPEIAVEALGPDGQTIESWRITSPRATMTPGSVVPFKASFLSPDQTVVEVNLSFVEPPHDEP